MTKTMPARRLVTTSILMLVLCVSLRALLQSNGGAGNCNGGGSCSGNGNGNGNCFPANAQVFTAAGSSKRMDELETGEVVAVIEGSGKIGYEPIYAWGHRHDGSAAAVRLHLDNYPASAASDSKAVAAAGTAHVLELTPTHYVLVAGPRDGVPLHKRAGDVVVGDIMWVAAPDAAAASTPSEQQQQQHQLVQQVVISIEASVMQGLYNPYTLGGSIIVEGVVASSHSWWFADAAADMLGLPTSWLPHLYQAALAPARGLWWLLGPQAYVDLYESLDSQMDFANLLSSSSGLLGAAARLAGVLLLAYVHAAAKLMGAWVTSPTAAAAALLGGMAVSARSKGGLFSKGVKVKTV